MPIMTLKEFEDRTSVTLTTRGKALKSIGDRLKQYIQQPGDNTLESLSYALGRWQDGHSLDAEDKESWMMDRRNKKGAITELSNWVKRKVNEDAIIAFKRAAIALHQIYGPLMDDHYRAGFVAIFINSEVDSTEPMTSLIHWKNEGKWQSRLGGVGWTPAQGKTNGLTSPWDAPALARTTRSVGAATCGATAPENRIIEVAELNHHTICHEMLHWLTHESFRVHVNNITDTNLRKYILEGLTEFLTRKGLDDWDHGGYTDLVPLWKKMMSGNSVIQFSQLAATYFKGRNIEETQQTITQYAKNDKDYKKAQDAAFLAAIRGMY